MGLLSPRRAKGEASRVAEFWSWWSANRLRVVASAQAERMQEVAQLLDPAIDRLHKEVGWEFGPGHKGRPWQLVATPGGVRAVLPFTVAWCDAAPPDDLVEFYPARPRLPDAIEGAVLEREGSSLALDETLVRVTGGTSEKYLDIEVHHPAFARMSENDQYSVTFQALDLAIGEFVVMTCLHQIVPRAARTPDMRPLANLPDVIKEAFPKGPQ